MWHSCDGRCSTHVLFHEIRAFPRAPAVHFNGVHFSWFLQPPILQRTCCVIAFIGTINFPWNTSCIYSVGMRVMGRMGGPRCLHVWPGHGHRAFCLAVTALSLLDFGLAPGGFFFSVQQLRVVFKAVYLHVQSPLILSTLTTLLSSCLSL